MEEEEEQKKNNKNVYRINESSQNNSNNNSQQSQQTIYFGGERSKRSSEKSNYKSAIGYDIRRSSNYFQQQNLDGQKQQSQQQQKQQFQESIIYDRRSDSLNHQQSLNNFINSRQNSEIIIDKQPKGIGNQNNSSQNYYQHTKSSNKITYNNHKDQPSHSQISRNMSSIVPQSYYTNNKSNKQMNTQLSKNLEEIAILEEDREPHASHLSDENGRIINEMKDVNDRYFYKSGLKGIIYLVSESSHAAIAILPYFFSQFGILPSILLILTLITVSNYSFFYLLKAKNLSRRSNYHTIAQFLSGMSGYRFIFIVQFLTKFANCTLLMHFAAKQMQQFILNVQSKQDFTDSQLSFPESYPFYLLIMSLCMVALSLFVVLTHQTTFTQLINLLFLIIMICLTFISFINTLQTEELKGDYIFTPDDFEFGYAFSSLSLLFFLLDIHINFFNVYKFMRKPSDKKMFRTSLYANMILGLCYILIGSFGYITTTDLDRNVNYLVSFSQLNLHITFSSIALLIYVIYCLINFPLQFSIARSHLLKIIRTFQFSKKASTFDDFPQDHYDRDRLDHPQFFKSSQQHEVNQNNNNNNNNNNYHYNYGYNNNNYNNYNNYNNNYNGNNDLNNQLLQSNDIMKNLEDSNIQQTHISVRQIRFYAVSIIIFLIMVIINFFVTDPLIIVLVSGVFFSSINAFIIPIAFYIKLSNYESTLVVILSVLLLFTIIGLDFTTLLGEVFTLIE